MTDPKIVISKEVTSPEEQVATDKTLELYRAVVEQLENADFPIEEDNDNSQERDVIVALVINLMVNRNYCVDCFMARLLEVSRGTDDAGLLYRHSSEEEKQNMN